MPLRVKFEKEDEALNAPGQGAPARRQGFDRVRERADRRPHGGVHPRPGEAPVRHLAHHACRRLSITMADARSTAGPQGRPSVGDRRCGGYARHHGLPRPCKVEMNDADWGNIPSNTELVSRRILITRPGNQRQEVLRSASAHQVRREHHAREPCGCRSDPPTRASNSRSATA